ncbi:MAG: adenosylmethionine decarboxylase [Endozoicomonadaceae bacterium]|nr:adenosylmethionine decarboxylase [Endozoicomonadaceae bacterium]MBE8232478.1 adenosylmethionine decarboxylase [Endozoicomonadaceae bacterium]
MFFEGVEKKYEVLVYPHTIDLITAFDQSFWSKMVHICDAKILSMIQNQHCIAYLLSESSLFIWSHRIVMVTCGNTCLVKAMMYLIEHIGQTSIQHFFYQRKNEYCSHLQASDFHQDVIEIQKKIPGNSYRLGYLDNHHLHLFHYSSTSGPVIQTKPAYELLMHHIDATAATTFMKAHHNQASIREILSFEQHLKSWVCDEHLFSPCGYSMNALRESHYMTIHITPENPGSYMSVESDDNLLPYAKTLLALFQPKSFDFIIFNNKITQNQLDQFTDQYHYHTRVTADLCNQDQVIFNTFFTKKQQIMTAESLYINRSS